MRWFVNVVSEYSTPLGWISFFISLIPVVVAHRALRKQAIPKGSLARRCRQIEFFLLWCIPLLGFVATKASEWSSEKLEASHKAATNDIATLKTSLALARTNMEALEASQQPRRITPAQHDIIARNLSKWMIRDKCKVELACLGGDHEAREYIIQIRKSLSACGFVVEENGVLNLPETKDGPVSGIHFSVKSAKFPPKGAKDVIAALREAGIIPTFTQEQANLKEDRLYIFVGPKPLK